MRVADRVETSVNATMHPSLTTATAGEQRLIAVALEPEARTRQVARFTWHFFQMFIAMMLGMVPLIVVLTLLGVRSLSKTQPEFFASLMALFMVLPMAVWMRFRMGHNWARTTEMSAAMVLPVAVLVPLCLVGVLPHTAAVGPSHMLMPMAMLGDMGYRWRDYAQQRH